jgi:signal transduction histidine kinase
MMWLDRWRVERALTNLVENVITYTRHARSGGQVGIQMGVDAPWVWVAVTDNGPGINPVRLRRSDCLQEIHRADTPTDGMGLILRAYPNNWYSIGYAY